MPEQPHFVALGNLNSFLSHGRRDYDWVAGRVYAACFNDEYVMQKILTAEPEDVPSSEAEDASSDEGIYLTRGNGSKENPVVFDEDEVQDDRTNNKPDNLKRKRPASNADEHTAEKKLKQPGLTLLCLNCGSKFNSNRNKEGACRYHPSETILGELELNPTNDYIEDDEASRETWPNAFQWDCCETNFEDAGVEPCKLGRHRADGGEKTEYAERKETTRRRRKYYGLERRSNSLLSGW